MTPRIKKEETAENKLKNFLLAVKPSWASFGIYSQALVLAGTLVFVTRYSWLIEKITFVPALIHLVIVYLTLSIFWGSIALAINFLYRKKNKLADKYTDSFTLGITRLASFFFWIIFILVVVDTLFFPVKNLLTSLSILVAVISLAFRDYITNFVNGINIMFSGKFQLGEYVKVGDSKGKIKDITFTHVHLLTESQDVVFIPNNIILSKEAINYSKSRIKNVFVQMVIDRVYYEYYKELRQHIIVTVQKKFSDVISDKKHVKIRVESLEKESMKWIVEYRVSRYDFELETALKDYTAETMVDFLNIKEQQKKEEKEIKDTPVQETKLAEKEKKSSKEKGIG